MLDCAEIDYMSANLKFSDARFASTLDIIYNYYFCDSWNNLETVVFLSPVSDEFINRVPTGEDSDILFELPTTVSLFHSRAMKRASVSYHSYAESLR